MSTNNPASLVPGLSQVASPNKPERALPKRVKAGFRLREVAVRCRYLILGLALSSVTTSLPAAPLPLKVVGNQLLDSKGDLPRLRGVNCASLEWSSDGDGRILKTVQVAVHEWHANLIRLPLSQDRWFGKGPEQKDGGAGYRQVVGQLVEFCATNNAYVILDLHWSNAGEWGKNIGQHNLPDTNSVTFWKDLATAFKDHPAVLFDLYNEPAHVNWDQWLKGGPITETDKKTKTKLTYEAVGMQALVDAIRSTGAKNGIARCSACWKSGSGMGPLGTSTPPPGRA